MPTPLLTALLLHLTPPAPAPVPGDPGPAPGPVPLDAPSLATPAIDAPGIENRRPDDRPNVVLIVTDDQGAADVGAFGATDLRTPALDRLAARGVRLTRCYAAAPVCSPSRAALLTGRSPQAAGVPGNVSPEAGAGSGLPTEQVTLPEHLRAAGYRTALVGKWHLGHDPGLTPEAQGFERWFGHLVGCIDNWSHFFFWSGPNRHDLYRDGVEVFRDGEYFPDLMLAEARDFLRAEDDRPFFLYFASNAPHYPYQGEAERLRAVRARGVEHPRDLYAAFLESLDARIGGLLDELDALGIADRTLVVLQSDHGHSTELRAHGGGGSAGALRGAKFSLFEGGLRVPAIVAWPGRLPAGTTRDQLASAVDWLPTILDLAGVPAPSAGLAGRSLVPVLEDPEAPTHHAVLHWASGEQWAVRRGRWKLLHDALDTTTLPHRRLAGPFLVDLEADPGETTDRSAEHPALVAELTALHAAWVAGGH